MKKASRPMLKEDGDDAHFSDNPAVRKPKRKAGGRGKAMGTKKRSGRKSKR